jgi:NTF2 fold immunity protein
MTRTQTLIALGLAAAAPALAAQQPIVHSYIPPGGFIPDSATAVAVAVAIWSPIYGAAQIETERPYVAHLHGGVWTVSGSLPSAPSGSATIGGVATAEIAKVDGRVLRVSHGK